MSDNRLTEAEQAEVELQRQEWVPFTESLRRGALLAIIDRLASQPDPAGERVPEPSQPPNSRSTMTRPKTAPGAVLTERVTGDDNWRHSRYERADGSEVRVSIPSWRLVDPMDGNPAGRVYDEAAEARGLMELLGYPRLVPIPSESKENR